MDPITAALAAVPAVIGGIQSIAGSAKARKAEKNRPVYEIPQETYAATSIAQMQASDPYQPGYAQAKSNIDVAAANALQVASQSGNASAALQGVVGQQEAGLRSLAESSAQYQSSAQTRYMGQLGEMAAAQDTRWQLNEYAPYAQKYQEGRDMVGAGMQNINTGIGNFISLRGK